MNASNIKGLALERAVQLVEETIIRGSPSLKKAEFSIERRKIFTVSGVRHEIDLWVEIQKGTHFEAVHIFETKNHRNPISKSEVIDFSEKIRVTGAAKGYFVAKKFSSSARAQAEQDKHMKLVEVTEDFASALDGVQFISSGHRLENLVVSIKDRNAPPSEHPAKLDHQMVCHFQGTPTTVLTFCTTQAEKVVTEVRQKDPTRFGLPGTHSNRTGQLILFDLGELRIGGIDVEQMSLDITYSVHTTAARIISKYEMAGRGRVFTFQADHGDDPQVSLQFDIVQVIS